MHDELGQALTGLKMDLYWLAHRLPKKLRAVQKKTKDMSAHIDTTKPKRIVGCCAQGLIFAQSDR